jgi:hypothetical protein
LLQSVFTFILDERHLPPENWDFLKNLIVPDLTFVFDPSNLRSRMRNSAIVISISYRANSKLNSMTSAVCGIIAPLTTCERNSRHHDNWKRDVAFLDRIGQHGHRISDIREFCRENAEGISFREMARDSASEMESMLAE